MEWSVFAAVSGEAWLKTLIGILGFVTTILGFFKWYLPWRRTAREQKIEQMRDDLQKALEDEQINALRAMAKMYTLIDQITSQTEALADRVIIFAGHNGGGLPEAGKPYYVSAINSSLTDYRPRQERPESRYTEITVDRQYVNLLLQCYEEGYVLLETEKMPICDLKDWYTQEGVVQSLVFFLKITGRHFVYASVATTQKEFSPEEIIEIKRTMNMVRTALR